MNSELNTVKDVVKALGGVRPIAELTGRDYDTAWQWTRWPHFPPDTYVVLQNELTARGLSAPAKLWRMVPPIDAPSDKVAS